MKSSVPPFTRAIWQNHRKLQSVSPSLYAGHFLLDCLVHLILEPENNRIEIVFHDFLIEAGEIPTSSILASVTRPFTKNYNALMVRLHELLDPLLDEEETDQLYDETCEVILSLIDPERSSEILLRALLRVRDAVSERYRVPLNASTPTPVEEFLSTLEDRMPESLHDPFSIMMLSLEHSGTELRDLPEVPADLVYGILNMATWTEVHRMQKLEVYELADMGLPGKNAPCPCGSGLPFYKCCGM